MSRKPTIVFLHAMGASHRMWQAQMDELAGDFELVAPDLPGHGDNRARFTMESAVDLVLRTIRINTSGPVYLVGASLGGTVALHVALAAPARVAGLLMSGAMVHPPRASLAVQRAVTALLPLRVLAVTSARIVAPARDEDRDAFMLDIWRAGKRTQFDALRALRKDRVIDRLPRVTVPTLVCCGDRDRMNLASAQSLTEQIPGARLRIVEDGDHLWNLQRPDECTAIVREFVAEH